MQFHCTFQTIVSGELDINAFNILFLFIGTMSISACLSFIVILLDVKLSLFSSCSIPSMTEIPKFLS